MGLTPFSFLELNPLLFIPSNLHNVFYAALEYDNAW